VFGTSADDWVELTPEEDARNFHVTLSRKNEELAAALFGAHRRRRL
jgi:hypothetical protein